MRLIDGDAARQMLRQKIGQEWGALTQFARQVEMSTSWICKMRIGEAPITNNVAQILGLQQLWDQDRYIYVGRNFAQDE